MNKTTMLNLFRSFIKDRETSRDIFSRRKPVTLQAYYNKYQLVSDFLWQRDLVKIKAVEFSIVVANDLFKYLMEKNYKHNYAARVVEICRAVLDFGAKNLFITHNPIHYFKIKKTRPEKPTFFTTQQIQAFENYNSFSSMKQKAAHLFVLQMHTGFDYGDFKEITRDNFVIFHGRKYLVKPRNKNGNEAVIPLSDKAEIILELYDYKMRILSNPKYNMAIKLVASDLSINMHLTSKSARKIFMMNKLNNEGFSMEAVSKMGGHKTVRTTENYYAQVNINLIDREMSRLGK